MDPTTAVAVFLAHYIAHHGLDKGVKAGAALIEKKRLQRITGSVSRLVGRHKASALLKRRNELTSRLMQHYIHDGRDIIGTGDVRIGYKRCFEFFRGLAPNGIPSKLTVSVLPPYDVDKTLSIPGFKKSAIAYRLEQKHKKPFDGHAVRIARWDGRAHFEIAQADYLDQFVTNQTEAVDIKLEHLAKPHQLHLSGDRAGSSLRELETIEAALPAFEQSRLANTLGMAAMVITSDGYLVLPRRNKTVHFAAGYEGCSVSGVVEWSTGLSADFLGEVQQQLLGKEAAKELLLGRRDCHVVPLAFARELERAGKPQLFFLLFVDRLLDSLVEAWEASEYPKEEYDSIRWIRVVEPKLLRTDPASAAESAARALMNLCAQTSAVSFPAGGSLVLSEEARANLFYVAVYLIARGAAAFPKRWVAD